MRARMYGGLGVSRYLVFFLLQGSACRSCYMVGRRLFVPDVRLDVLFLRSRHLRKRKLR